MGDDNYMRDFLEKQLERTNYWLAFAEAKNAATIACNVGIIALGFGTKLVEEQKSIVVITLLFMSTIVALLSFFPDLRSIIKHKSISCTDESNLIFFGDIATFESHENYLNSVKEKYSFTEETTKLYEDIASEIYVNSKICVNKYNMFKVALIIDMIALIMLCLIIIFS